MTTAIMTLPGKGRQDAAADFCRRQPANRRSWGQGWGHITICLLLIAIGGGLMFKSALIHAKALLGPILLQQAWHETLATGLPTKPWSWADIQTSGRLRAPEHGIDLVALDNSSGEALTWGPGFWTDPALADESGLTILTGHRDTHFAFLSDINPGDRLLLQTKDGATHQYVTAKTQVVDVRYDRITKPDAGEWLLLITCHPFGSVLPDPPERFLVWARRQSD